MWPDADRAKANNPGNDYHGPSIPIECRRRSTIALPAWTRRLRDLHEPNPWALLILARDLRRQDAIPDLYVFPAWFGVELLRAWEGQQ